MLIDIRSKEKMKAELIEVSGLKGALLGMRLPMCKDLKENIPYADILICGEE